MSVEPSHNEWGSRLWAAKWFFLVGMGLSFGISIPEWLRADTVLAPLLDRWDVALLTLFVSAARVFALYALCVAVAVVLVGRALPTRVVTICQAVAVSHGIYWYAIFWGDDTWLEDTFTSVPGILVLVVLSALLYRHIPRVQLTPEASRYLRLLAIVSMAILAEVWLLRWSVRYGAPDTVELHAQEVLIAYSVVVLGTLLPVFRSAHVNGALRLLVIPVALVALSGTNILVGLKAAPASGTADRVPEAPPVILITVDTLRADALSMYPPGTGRTPHIERLAEDSVVFTHAVSPSSWTVPAMMSVMTGTDPNFHHVGLREETFDLQRAAMSLPTLAGQLAIAGYATKAIVGNPLLDAPLNVVDGFADYDVYSDVELGHSSGARLLSQRFPLRFATGGNTETLTRLASEWVQQADAEPFFLWLHYMDPHSPFAPPPEAFSYASPSARRWMRVRNPNEVVNLERFSAEDEETLRTLYAAEVSHVDHHIGQLLELLRERGLYHDALIILTSDHGEEFFEHDNFGHGHSMHSEVLHVPLIVKLPGSAPAHEIGAVVSTQALAPTVLDLVGLSYEPGPTWLQSLAGLAIASAADDEREPVVSAGVLRTSDEKAMIADQYKLIYRPQSGAWKLYDLQSDPEERYPLSDPLNLARGTAMREDLQTHLRSMHAARRQAETSAPSRDPGQIDQELLRRLQALGYMR